MAEHLSGPITFTPNKHTSDGEEYFIQLPGGVGWHLPVTNLTPADLRALADRLEAIRERPWEVGLEQTTPRWFPMETAPKDGTRFLFTNGIDVVGTGFFVHKCFAADSWQGSRNTTPTGWKPLPNPRD